MYKILIVGIGSILRGDDGVGVRVIDELEKEKLPSNVKLHSGDVSGLDLLKVFPGFQKIIIVDAADMGKPPGAIKVFDQSKIKKINAKEISTHGFKLSDTLLLAKKIGLDYDITIVGIQPEDTSYNLALSKSVKKSIPKIKEKIRQLISC